MPSLILKEFLAETKNKIDPLIEEIIKLNLDPEREEMMLHQIRVGGKRLRPALAVASCFLFGGEWDNVAYPAAGLEILHNYTLIVDDIIDNSVLRRGKETTWKKYGQSMAQCAGMHYAVSLFQAAQMSSHSREVGECLAETLKTVIGGEINDVLADVKLKKDIDYLKEQKYEEITLKDYYQIIADKTASLMSASVRVGAISASAPKDLQDEIARYGFNLGMAFQISDDILDIFGNEDEFGKEIGKDIKEGKRSNIVIISALAEMSGRDSKQCFDFLEKEDKGKEQLSIILEKIKSTEALQKATSIGNNFINKARQSLNKLPDNEWRILLSEFLDEIIVRNK
jgi:geranylgeranyl diphosphate synthase, type I